MNEVARQVITIDPDFAAIWGDLDDEAYGRLKHEIKADGIRDPLVIWNPNNDYILVDGHNRLRIAEELNMMAVPVSYKVFKDKAETAAWILNHQKARRNLTDWQQYKAAEVIQKILKEQARERQAEYHGNQYESAVLENPPKVQKPIDTRKETAKASGLSEWKIRQGDYVRAHATDEQKADLDSGKKDLKEVFKETLSANTPKKADRLKHAEAMVEATKPQEGKVASIQMHQAHKQAEQTLLEEKAHAVYDSIYLIIRESYKLTDDAIDLYREVYSKKDAQAYMLNARSMWNAGRKLMELGEWTQEVRKD